MERVQYGVIDIGSNSLRLMTGWQDDGGQWHFSPKQLATTRLGNHMDQTQRLDPDGIAASFQALTAWQPALEGTRVCAIATSAVREAKDGQAFLAEIRARYGWHCRAIPGQEEAALSFCGASSALPQEIEAGVLDIGGGSSELAIGRDGQVQWAHSYHLGAVRLTTQETWDDADVAALKAHCRSVLLPIPKVPDVLVGVGGTLTTLAAMDLGLVTYDATKVEGHVVRRETIGAWITKLQQMTPEERRHIPGLQPKRSDIILAGLVIAWSVLDFYDLPAIQVSERDLMEGVFYRHAFYDAAVAGGNQAEWT